MPRLNTVSYNASPRYALNETDSFSFIFYEEHAELPAESLALNTKDWIVWETLHGCQEGVWGDFPAKYQDIPAIFENQPGLALGDTKNCDYNHLLEVAGATNTSQHPWSLPAPLFQMSQEDAQLREFVRVCEVSHITPTAAVYVEPELPNRLEDESPYATPAFRDIASPLLLPTKISFASAVCTSSSQLSSVTSNSSFHVLRRHNRLATTSALRQLHAFGIDIPIIGVLFREKDVAFHVDWYETTSEDSLTLISVFYSADPADTEPRIWDLNNPSEVNQVLQILSNLRKHTQTTFAERIQQGLLTPRQPLKPWKWDASMLPSTLSRGRIHEHDTNEETQPEKLQRWRKSMDIVEFENSHIFAKRKLMELLFSPPTPEDSF